MGDKDRRWDLVAVDGRVANAATCFRPFGSRSSGTGLPGAWVISPFLKASRAAHGRALFRLSFTEPRSASRRQSRHDRWRGCRALPDQRSPVLPRRRCSATARRLGGGGRRYPL